MTIRELYEQSERYGVADRPLQVLVRGGSFRQDIETEIGTITQGITLPTHCAEVDRLEPAGMNPSAAMIVVHLEDAWEIEEDE